MIEILTIGTGQYSNWYSYGIVFDGSNLVAVTKNTSNNYVEFLLIDPEKFSLITNYAFRKDDMSIISLASNGAENIYILWQNRNAEIYLSSWPTKNPGAPLSEIKLDYASFGCYRGLDTSYIDLDVTYSGNRFYGVCYTGNVPYGRLRFFSFDVNGQLLTAMDLGQREGEDFIFPPRIMGLFVLNDSLVIGIGDSSSFNIRKYTLDFKHLVGYSSYYSSKYEMNNFSSDGQYLFLSYGSSDIREIGCSGYSSCVAFGKLSKGSL